MYQLKSRWHKLNDVNLKGKIDQSLDEVSGSEKNIRRGLNVLDFSS
jgi:hypothetical protein